MAGRGLGSIFGGVFGSPLTRAAALSRKADSACARGDHAAALPLEQEALALTVAALGENHLDTSQRLADVSGTLHFLGEDEASLPYAQRALASAEAAAGPDSDAVLQRLGNLTLVLSALGEHEESLALRMRGWVLACRLHPGDDPDRIIPAALVANSLDALERGAEAVPFRREALRLATLHFPPPDPRLARRIAELGVSLDEQGEHGEAAATFERALQALPPDHAATMDYLSRMGAALHAAGRPAEALKPLRTAMARAEQQGASDLAWRNLHLHLGVSLLDLERPAEAAPHLQASLRGLADPSAIASRLAHLARALSGIGRPEEARVLYDASLRQWSPPNEDTAIRLTNAACEHAHEERMEEALHTMEWALALTALLHGDTSVDFATRLGTMGELFSRVCAWPQALQAHQRVFEILDTHSLEADAERALAVTRLAHVHDELGNIEESVRLRHLAIHYAKRAHGAAHADVATYLNNLGGSLNNARRFSEAREHLGEAMELALQVAGPEAPLTALILNNLAFTLASLRERGAAQRLLTRALTILEARMGPDAPAVRLYMENLEAVLGAAGADA